MTVLTLTPAPGYYTQDTTVTVTGPANIAGVIVTTSGADPVIVRTVASSPKYGPEYPYIQTIEDGRGRAVFDGAFTKFYNDRWVLPINANGNPTSFAELSPAFKFLFNAINFIRKNGTGNRLLVLGDKYLGAIANNNYLVKAAYEDQPYGTVGWRTSMTGIANLMGLALTIKDAADYPGNHLNPTYAECMNYDMIIMFSSLSGAALITPAGAANIAQARRDGVGLYVCTDNGGGPSGDPNARYPEGFYEAANVLLAAITNANFQGNMDFAPGTTVEYNVAKWGDSPLFANMVASDIIGASSSDSFVNQAVSTLQPLPVSVPITSGYTTVKFAIVDNNGNVTFEQYGYNVGQPPIIEMTDEFGNILENGWAQTNLRQRKPYFEYMSGPFGNCSGFVMAGDTVIGEFSNVPHGPLTISWFDTAYTSTATGNLITMPGTMTMNVRVLITVPVVFEYQWAFDRLILTEAPGVDYARFIQQINKNEFASGADPTLPLRHAREQLYNPSVAVTPPTLPETLRAIYTAMT